MSKAIFIRRQTALKTKLASRGLDGMLLTNLTNIRYICGFTGSSAACLITPEGQYFLSDGRYKEQSKKQVQGFNPFIDNNSHLENAKKNNLIPSGLKLAFEGDFVSVNLFRQMKDYFPATQWESTTRIVEEIAVVKDDSELEALRTAVAITDRVYAEVLPMIKIGVTEKEIASELVIRYRKYGDGEAFPPIVAAGPNGALPHAVPSDRPFERGDFVVVDAAAIFAGYHADMTRTPLVGQPADKQREIYEVVKEAQKRGCHGVKAGMSCKEADSLTRDYITEQGYGDYYVHSTGHGLGLETHTMPRLNQQSTDTLGENYVVTIEPGIYLPGWGGVRIEDDVIIKQNGSEVLNKTTKELVILT